LHRIASAAPHGGEKRIDCEEIEMRRSLKLKWTTGLAVGAVALCGIQGAEIARADTAPVMAAPMQATPVTGTVVRYYVDRAGYVTAVDIQTATGVQMVRFAPGQAQRLTSTYPVGSKATIFVTTYPSGTYLAGYGPDMPAPGAMFEPYTVTDLDLLKSEPYTLIGAKPARVEGTLTGFIKDDTGEVLALVLDKNKLIRVPRENRLDTAKDVPDGLTPLMKNAKVVAMVLPEATPYGIVSPYESRWIATTISVDGWTLGPKGFGKLDTKKGKTLFGFDLSLGPVITGQTPEEIHAGQMGYYTYMMPAAPK
jgi:hypothetical protein